MDEVQEIKMLAGIANRPQWQEYNPVNEKNMSYTGTEKSRLMKKHKIKPGTDAWFKLWFSKPYMTGERPI